MELHSRLRGEGLKAKFLFMKNKTLTMTKKVLMLQLVDKVSGCSSIDFMISQMQRHQEINGSLERVYNIEFKYYSKNVCIEEVTSMSEEMFLALNVSNYLVDYIDGGRIDYLDN